MDPGFRRECEFGFLGERGSSRMADMGSVLARETGLSFGQEQELHLAWPIDLGLTVASHGWVRLEPWRWHSETGTLLHTERIGGRIGTIGVRQRDARTLVVAWDGFLDETVPEILRR